MKERVFDHVIVSIERVYDLAIGGITGRIRSHERNGSADHRQSRERFTDIAAATVKHINSYYVYSAMITHATRF